MGYLGHDLVSGESDAIDSSQTGILESIDFDGESEVC